MYFCNIFLLLFATTVLVVNGENHNVTVGPEMGYTPNCLKIGKGDTVHFHWAFMPNKSPVPHTVTESVSFEYRCDNKKGGFHTGVKYSGDSWQHTFDFEDSEVAIYHCRTTGESCQNCAGGMWGQIVQDEKDCKPISAAKGSGKKSPMKAQMPKKSDADGFTGYFGKGFR